MLVGFDAALQTSSQGHNTHADRAYRACQTVQVTFFWNGNVSGYFNEELETYVEIPSDKVRSISGCLCHLGRRMFER